MVNTLIAQLSGSGILSSLSHLPFENAIYLLRKDCVSVGYKCNAEV